MSTSGTEESVSLRCYNVACGKTYSESENNDDSCIYHSGHPVFHDAFKSWSCCSKKTTDFTEFLNIPGCSRGKHSNVKPEPLVKQSKKSNEDMEKGIGEITNKPINLNDPVERPSAGSSLVNLSFKISPPLKSQLDRTLKETPTQKDLTESIDNTRVEIGTSCKNKGCKKDFQGPESNQEECLYHPGCPIFHEGMKYWSCCKRRTTDFETFLSQEGCQSGHHLWYELKPKEDSEESRKASCRFDWHQTGEEVVISIYSKLALPDKCVIKANPVKLEVKIIFNGHEEKLFTTNYILNNVIDVDKSYVEFNLSKVEICLKKVDKCFWKKLTFDD